jgi:hypothetical protein
VPKLRCSFSREKRSACLSTASLGCEFELYALESTILALDSVSVRGIWCEHGIRRRGARHRGGHSRRFGWWRVVYCRMERIPPDSCGSLAIAGLFRRLSRHPAPTTICDVDAVRFAALGATRGGGARCLPVLSVRARDPSCGFCFDSICLHGMSSLPCSLLSGRLARPLA